MNDVIIKRCPLCGHNTYVGIPHEAYDKYVAGAHIQDAWPTGTPTERETLISGLCPSCQEGVFSD